ncbi:EAL domain-containing protein [Demequina salsinemoris]|uniref:EAL domain-containing protein n=1 Tax=Demequina salsinemoris TaxID=577470 RepID=UPI0007822128|nr:EAL domain-containing protein [Demequina salsinemoris]
MLTTSGFDARWTTLLDDAIAGVGVGIHVQPVVDLTAGQVVAYETLARFSHEDAGGVSPDVWFGRAREHGLAADLQATVLRKALGLLPTLPAGTLLGLNLEPDTIASTQVREALLEHVDLSNVVVELTEHGSWSWDEIGPTVEELKARGARTAIDDAGAGYAVIHQIAQLEPYALKLDRVIVDGVAQDVGRQALVSMIIGMAKRAGAVVVAEGVENMIDAQRLIASGVTLAQGYLIAAPGEPWPQPDEAKLRVLAAAAEL